MTYLENPAALAAMVHLPRARALLFTFVTALFCVPLAAAAELHWPPGELSTHVQAYFAQLRGSEADARQFFTEHMSPAALADVPVDERMARRTAMLQRTQGLTALEVVTSEPARMEVRCSAK